MTMNTYTRCGECGSSKRPESKPGSGLCGPCDGTEAHPADLLRKQVASAPVVSRFHYMKGVYDDTSRSS